jgi:hypothetical protein
MVEVMKLLRLAAVSLSAALVCAAGTGFQTGRLELKSAGPLAFGADGILFIGDSISASVFALDTGDTVKSAAPHIEITGIDSKIAALLGTQARQILIHDVKVNPLSKNVYISVSRGRGPDALPVVIRLDATGKLIALDLDSVSYSTARIPNPPVSNLAAERRNPRLETITQIGWVEGKVIVAGLSNEEFASNLRTIPFPFTQADRGASIKIFHGSHGEYETQAPVRTFVPMKIAGVEQIVAAYTCTPLVIMPVSALKPGAKVTGRTIAELGMGNRPLDMIAYRKDGHDFILLANSYRGTMKLSAENLDQYPPIEDEVTLAGVHGQHVSALKDVLHLAKLDDDNAIVLALAGRDSLDLRSVPLP